MAIGVGNMSFLFSLFISGFGAALFSFVMMAIIDYIITHYEHNTSS